MFMQQVYIFIRKNLTKPNCNTKMLFYENNSYFILFLSFQVFDITLLWFE